MPKVRNWDAEIKEAREMKMFSDEAKQDSQDFQSCYINLWNRRAGRELQREYPILQSLGYAFCASVCHDEPEITVNVKDAIDAFCNKYLGLK